MENVRIPRRAALAAAGLAALMPLRRARAQQYPDRPIKWIVAYAAGGGTDTLARVLGAAMSPKLGQPVVIDNRPGAATNIGAEATAKSAPDGYTVFSADNGTLVFNPALFRRLPYDPERDFRPIGLMARFPLVLTVKQDSAFGGARDLVEAAKAKPGQIDYGSPGVGSPHHLTMERLSKEAGVRFNHVPYRGAAPALNDLLAGTFESMVIDLPSGAEYLRSGRVQAARHLLRGAAPGPAGRAHRPGGARAAGLRGLRLAGPGRAGAHARRGRRPADDGTRRGGSGPSRSRTRCAGSASSRSPAARTSSRRSSRPSAPIWVPLIKERGITLD